MSNKTYCDGCEKEIENVGYSAPRCAECSYGHDYHAACLKTIYGKNYCPEHVRRQENDQVIRTYMQKMWGDVGFPGEVSEHNGAIKSDIGPLKMVIEPEYNRDSDHLNSVNLVVKGLTATPRKFKINLHTHDDVVQKLKSAVVRSLRSSKSAITIQQKDLTKRVTQIDEIVTKLMDSLDGKLVDTKDLAPDEN